MDSEKGNVILLTIIGVATLLVAVAGTTFSYLIASKSGVEEKKTIEVTSGTLAIDYKDNSVINAGGVQPGEVLFTKTFFIKGTVSGSSTNLGYEAVLKVKNNTYADGELVYTLLSADNAKNGTIIPATKVEVKIPTGTKDIVLGKGSFAGPISDARHTYTLTVKYVGTEVSAGKIVGNIELNQTASN